MARDFAKSKPSLTSISSIIFRDEDLISNAVKSGVDQRDFAEM